MEWNSFDQQFEILELLKTDSNISKVYAIHNISFSQVIAIAQYGTEGNRENLQHLKMERHVQRKVCMKIIFHS